MLQGALRLATLSAGSGSGYATRRRAIRTHREGARLVSTTDNADSRSPLESDLGTTTIQDTVVSAIVGIAAEEVEGVSMSHGGTRLPGDTSPTVGEFVDNLTGGGGRARGLSVDVGEHQAAADVTVNVVYGRSIPELT